MSANVYGINEFVGTSADSVDQAIQVGIERASASLHTLDWFEITQIRGHIVAGKVAHYQVGLKVGFRLDDPA